MAIIRRRHNGNFTIIGNQALNDPNVSPEALGALCYLLGRPDNWELSVTQLAGRFKCGRDKIYRIIKELVGLGYITVARPRSGGRYSGVVYDVRDTPLRENSDAVKPDQVETTLIKTDSLTRTDSNKWARADFEEWFEGVFWGQIPLRLGSNPRKPASDLLYDKIKNGENPENVIAGLRQFRAQCERDGITGTRFVKSAVNWIRDEGWNDDPLPLEGGSDQASVLEALKAEAREQGRKDTSFG